MERASADRLLPFENFLRKKLNKWNNNDVPLICIIRVLSGLRSYDASCTISFDTTVYWSNAYKVYSVRLKTFVFVFSDYYLRRFHFLESRYDRYLVKTKRLQNPNTKMNHLPGCQFVPHDRTNEWKSRSQDVQMRNQVTPMIRQTALRRNKWCYGLLLMTSL